MMSAEFKVIAGATSSERDRQAMLLQSLRAAPLPDGELLHNLGLFLSRQTLSRLLFMSELYRMIVPVHGIVCEFGVRWGQNLALFLALRGMLEPYNYSRTVVGFDTWDGFPSVDPKDGARVTPGAYGVTADYLSYLDRLLALHEAESPIAHERKFELVRGDATITFGQFLERNPQTIVALAYFDFDLYEPTRRCLELLMPRLTRGSVVAFDELNCRDFPGETLAVMETIGLSRYAIRRTPHNPLVSYLVIE